MALLKDQTLPIGFTASYWRINYLTIDKKGQQIHVVMQLYKDRDTRQEGEHCLDKGFTFTGSDYLHCVDSATGDIKVELLYEKIKTLKEFETAEDC